MSNLEHGIAAYDASDFSQALEILLPLAQAGNFQAQKIVANIYDFGHGVEVNAAEAVKWYRLAAEQGDPVAQNNLAALVLNENPEEAMKWYFAAAKQGFPFAQDVLGDIYSGDLSVPGDVAEKFRDDAEAVKWYKKAAAHGSPIARHRLGEMYAIGQGVAKDEAQAVQWYRQVADKDYGTSQEVLAEAYQRGLLGLPYKDKFNSIRA